MVDPYKKLLIPIYARTCFTWDITETIKDLSQVKYDEMCCIWEIRSKDQSLPYPHNYGEQNLGMLEVLLILTTDPLHKYNALSITLLIDLLIIDLVILRVIILQHGFSVVKTDDKIHQVMVTYIKHFYLQSFDSVSFSNFGKKYF